MNSNRPNCFPCTGCGRCTGCGIQMVINRNDERDCAVCHRYKDNGMARTPRKDFFDGVTSGALVLRKRGLAIVA